MDLMEKLKAHTPVEWAGRACASYALGNIVLSAMPGGVVMKTAHLVGGLTVMAALERGESIGDTVDAAAEWVANKIVGQTDKPEEVEEEIFQ